MSRLERLMHVATKYSRRIIGLGLSPYAPRSPALPSGATVPFYAPEDEDQGFEFIAGVVHCLGHGRGMARTQELAGHLVVAPSESVGPGDHRCHFAPLRGRHQFQQEVGDPRQRTHHHHDGSVLLAHDVDGATDGTGVGQGGSPELVDRGARGAWRHWATLSSCWVKVHLAAVPTTAAIARRAWSCLDANRSTQGIGPS